MALVRVEYKTTDGDFGTFSEGTLDEAKAYLRAMRDNEVEIEFAYFYDHHKRIADIQAGKKGHDESEALFKFFTVNL